MQEPGNGEVILGNFAAAKLEVNSMTVDQKLAELGQYTADDYAFWTNPANREAKNRLLELFVSLISTREELASALKMIGVNESNIQNNTDPGVMWRLTFDKLINKVDVSEIIRGVMQFVESKPMMPTTEIDLVTIKNQLAELGQYTADDYAFWTNPANREAKNRLLELFVSLISTREELASALKMIGVNESNIQNNTDPGVMWRLTFDKLINKVDVSEIIRGVMQFVESKYNIPNVWDE